RCRTMCGIAGLISFGRAPDAAAVVRDMTAALTHRGPDGEGWWSDGEAALGHRRLASIDVVGGAQPLVNETGSVRVVCNGEIYNYRELRLELQARGHHFRTASDCETIAHLYEDDGPDGVAKLHGMFALAIWDRAAERLVLARDRLGIKPLFYTSGPRGFGFASEIKALVAGRLTQRQVDPGALLHYLSCGYVPGAATIYRDVQRLAPGELLVADRDGVERRPYWGWQPGLAPRSRAAAEEELRSLLIAAVREHLVADVPVGAFLSGGIDSSVVSILGAAVPHVAAGSGVGARTVRPRQPPRGGRSPAPPADGRRRHPRHGAALRALGAGVRGGRGPCAGPGPERRGPRERSVRRGSPAV